MVCCSYQIPTGIVNGIQWVRGEATHSVPVGAQPASVEFAASWNRRTLGRDDEKASNDWGRDEQRRMEDTEKEVRRLREQGQGRIDHDAELRQARERDAQARERRKSFNAGTPAPPPAASGGGGYAYPSTGSGGGTSGYPGPGYPPSPYSGYGDSAASPSGGYAASGGSNYSHERKYSSGAGYSDLDRQLGDLDLRDRDGRPRNEVGGGSRSRAASPNPYGAAAATGAAYGGGRPYSAAGYQRSASPNVRSTEAPFVPPGGGGYPPSNYSTTRGTGAISRSTTPFGGPPKTYPAGSLPGDRSRAASPVPGGPPPGGPYSSGAIGGGYQPQHGRASPNPVPFTGEHHQLAAPEGFVRPVNGSHPFSPFDIMKIQDMEKFWSKVPRMPPALATHDVFEEDWRRFMQDMALAWAGKLPVPDGPPQKRSGLIADLIELWNTSFFLIRGAELVLYKGRERRTGRHIGVIDKDLPYLDEADDYISSSDEEEPVNSDSDLDYGQGRHQNFYGNPQQQLAEVFEEGRHREEAKKQAKAERRRRRHERNRRRREKYRERKYSLYLTYVPTSVVGGPGRVGGHGVPGGYPPANSHGHSPAGPGGYSPAGPGGYSPAAPGGYSPAGGGYAGRY
ncbi:hypothetical protein DXG03_008150 [Asterophora parasitica]|uniref:Uncharacterized protein n=1 Tax=Asterophora parasitica TaxID=117018 RepID=A0A9P7KAG1_9AGAR|nr:hypothetical protein DXG03_008150 [Asterophora parasitica]